MTVSSPGSKRSARGRMRGLTGAPPGAQARRVAVLAGDQALVDTIGSRLAAHASVVVAVGPEEPTAGSRALLSSSASGRIHLGSYEYADIDNLLDAATTGFGTVRTFVHAVVIDRSSPETDERALNLADELIRRVTFLAHRVGWHFRQSGGGALVIVLGHSGRPTERSARTFNAVRVGVRNSLAALARDWAGEGPAANLVVVPFVGGANEATAFAATAREPASVPSAAIADVVQFLATIGSCLNGQEIVLGDVGGQLL